MNLKLPENTVEIGDYILYKKENKYYELKVIGYQYCPSDCGWRYLTNGFSPTIDNENILKLIFIDIINIF